MPLAGSRHPGERREEKRRERERERERVCVCVYVCVSFFFLFFFFFFFFFFFLLFHTDVHACTQKCNTHGNNDASLALNGLALVRSHVGVLHRSLKGLQVVEWDRLKARHKRAKAAKTAAFPFTWFGGGRTKSSARHAMRVSLFVSSKSSKSNGKTEHKHKHKHKHIHKHKHKHKHKHIHAHTCKQCTPLWVGGSRDSSNGSAVEVVLSKDDLGLVCRNALDVIAPAASKLHASLPSLDTFWMKQANQNGSAVHSYFASNHIHTTHNTTRTTA